MIMTLMMTIIDQRGPPLIVSGTSNTLSTMCDVVARTNASMSSLSDQMGALMRILQQQQESAVAASATAAAATTRSSLLPPTAVGGASTSSPTRSVSPIPSPSSSVQVDSSEFVDRNKVRELDSRRALPRTIISCVRSLVVGVCR